MFDLNENLLGGTAMRMTLKLPDSSTSNALPLEMAALVVMPLLPLELPELPDPDSVA